MCFRPYSPIIRGYIKLCETTAWYIGHLLVEDLLKILRYKGCIADRLVHGNLEQPVDTLEVFTVLTFLK